MPAEDIPDSILELGARCEDDPEHLSQLARFSFQVWLKLGGASGDVSRAAIADLVQRSASMDDVSRHVRTALDYLSLWALTVEYFQRHGLGRVSYADLVTRDDHIAALREEICGRAADLSTTYGVSMLDGMLTSVHDRTAAATFFRAARKENPKFSAAHYLDYFASTYLTEREIAAEAEEIATRRATLLDGFEFLSEPPQAEERDILLLFSCDRSFFVTYFPFWAAAIAYLNADGVKLHFTLVGEVEEVAAAVEQGLALARDTSHLRGFDPAALADGLSFSRTPVPDYVEGATTFYACARYLLARHLAQHFGGRVLVADMDMMIKESPADFIRRLDADLEERVPVVCTRGQTSLVPARRFMAGTFPLPGGEVGDRFMTYVEDYTLACLSLPNSWTLDQSALAYAVEQHVAAHGADALFDLAIIQRPFLQTPVNKLYETSQRTRSS